MFEGKNTSRIAFNRRTATSLHNQGRRRLPHAKNPAESIRPPTTQRCTVSTRGRSRNCAIDLQQRAERTVSVVLIVPWSLPCVTSCLSSLVLLLLWLLLLIVHDVHDDR